MLALLNMPKKSCKVPPLSEKVNTIQLDVLREREREHIYITVSPCINIIATLYY